MQNLCKDSPPDPNDRAYFPTDSDLKIIYIRQSGQCNCDQENIKVKMENWKETKPESNHFFRPYLLKEEGN